MTTERIGVLLVHGIGTNTPNQFLVDQARKIVAAMSEEVAAIDVLSEPAVAPAVPDKYTVNYTANRVSVEVRTKGPDARTLLIDFNEVYWADLGEKPTLVNQVKFWFWALTMWALAARDFTRLPGFASMYSPKGGKIRWWGRLILGAYGVLFLLGAATIGLLNVLADRLKLPRVPISDILTAYVGDVMLYTQTDGDDDPAVSDLAQPPRVGIRARMVDALVEFALHTDYDRWYVLAHSQGTVVAYNGLMETEGALPNYLTQARWMQVRASGLRTTLAAPVPDLMLPRRPTWLQPTDGIDRRALFAKLGGLLTFGSAIGKFHAIWPITVPANKDENVFQQQFHWINVYDPTDPVSGSLNAYSRAHGHWADERTKIDGARSAAASRDAATHVAAKIDRSIPYKSGPLWLLSHLQYLNYYSPGYQRQSPLLVTEVARWMIGGSFDAARTLEAARPSVLLRSVWNYFQVLVATVAVWLSTSALLYELAGKWLKWLDHLCWPITAFTALIVAIAFNFAIQGYRAMTRGEPPPWLRAIIVLVAVVITSAACCSARHRSVGEVIDGLLDHLPDWPTDGLWAYLCVLVDAVKGAFELVHRHPAAVGMSVGLLSFTVVAIIVLGWLRWLIQPPPVQARDHEQGLRERS